MFIKWYIVYQIKNVSEQPYQRNSFFSIFNCFKSIIREMGVIIFVFYSQVEERMGFG